MLISFGNCIFDLHGHVLKNNILVNMIDYIYDTSANEKNLITFEVTITIK